MTYQGYDAFYMARFLLAHGDNTDERLREGFLERGCTVYITLPSTQRKHGGQPCRISGSVCSSMTVKKTRYWDEYLRQRNQTSVDPGYLPAHARQQRAAVKLLSSSTYSVA